MAITRAVLVDDDVNIGTLMNAFFSKSGEVELCGIAHDGEEGLEMIRQLEPELVLLDLILPQRSGLSIIDALRSDALLRQCKTIVITHLSNHDTVRRVLALGVDYYFMKPVSLSELQRVIRLLFEEQQGTCAAGYQAGRLLKAMGAEESDLGFYYTASAAEALADFTAGRHMLLKEAYYTAIQSDHTNYACVEKNIRATVRKIHGEATHTYRDLMGGIPTRPPKNGEFLPRLAARLRQMTGK